MTEMEDQRQFGQLMAMVAEIQRRMDRMDEQSNKRETTAWEQRERLNEKMENFWIELRNVKHDQRAGEQHVNAAFDLTKRAVERVEKSVEEGKEVAEERVEEAKASLVEKIDGVQEAIKNLRQEGADAHDALAKEVDDLKALKTMATGALWAFGVVCAAVGAFLAWATGWTSLFKRV